MIARRLPGSPCWHLSEGMCQFILVNILTGTLLAACVQTPMAPSAPPQPPTVTPWPTPSDLTIARPYLSTSVWNTPLPVPARYDDFSDPMMETLTTGITSDPDQYTFPVYFADANTPRWDIPCRQTKCTIATGRPAFTTTRLIDVPIPTEARPSAGDDAQMIIIDLDTGAEYDLYHIQRTDVGWVVDNGSLYTVWGDGIPAPYTSRGAGVPYYAGLIRPWEIDQGRIEHALAFGYPHVAYDRCVFPASKTDGKSSLPYAIPEGARLQLDPSLTEADFDHLGLNRTGKIIARALQEYGMILIDVSGRPKVYAENLTDNPYATRQWTDPNLALTSVTIQNLPPDYFHVLALPPDYWQPIPNSPLHGNCHTFPSETQ